MARAMTQIAARAQVELIIMELGGPASSSPSSCRAHETRRPAVGAPAGSHGSDVRVLPCCTLARRALCYCTVSSSFGLADVS
jgi:hypothetical protein